jgi:hypothetical protein
MTRKRQSVTAADVRRMGGQPLDLVLARTWLDYAVHHASGGTLDALCVARRVAGDPVAVRLSEAAAGALAKACEAAGRVNTAAAIRAAVKVALEPPKEFSPLEHLESLAAEGALDADEVAELRRIMGGPKAKGGLFGG